MIENIKILIVEDESFIALEIKSHLTKLGHNVIGIAKDFDSTMKFIAKDMPELLFMDINLNNSKKDGIDTVNEIHKKNNIPVVYLTAFCDEETLYRAVVTNPISYLLKPYKEDELKSTLLLAIYKLNQTTNIAIDSRATELGFGYSYNREDEVLYYHDMYIKLSKNEKQLLNILLDAKGTMVLYTDIEYMIWPDKYVSKSSLRTLLYRLRAKLEYKLIETVHSVGCKLTLK